MNTLDTPEHWRDITIAEDSAHHLWQEKPIYNKRFKRVLKFHPPGLAPVMDDTGAYHIDTQGQPIYVERYLRTFGYYEGLAAIEANDGWFHIMTNGKPSYLQRYAWCGNFQEGLCTVRDFDNQYYHINVNGNPCYTQHYAYAGDFKEGFAVIHTHQGKCTHIDKFGRYIHGKWFYDLDVYHKGYARAKDATGWYHIDKDGNPAYPERFATVEPFYNDVARVETLDGGINTIDPEGHLISTIRPGNNLAQQISNDMVGFWKTEITAAAVQLGIFDSMPGTLAILAKKLALPELHLQRLLRALWELKLVQFDNKQWQITARGQLLMQKSYLANAAIMWSDVNNPAWKKLPDLIRMGYSEHHDSFKQLCNDPQKKLHYLQALEGYARQDFHELISLIDWSTHQSIMGIGYSSKAILTTLSQQFPDLALSFNPLHEDMPNNPSVKFLYQNFDIRKNWPENIDAIVLAKVLHYWPDHDVIGILQKASMALHRFGKIYLIEMLLSDKNPGGGLLDLNMLIETGGMLRTLSQWETIIDTVGLRIESVEAISDHMTVLSIGCK